MCTDADRSERAPLDRIASNSPMPPGICARGRLERRDLVVDLGSVVEVVLVLAGSREEELDAVAADAVVAGVQGRATDAADGAVLVGAARDPELDLHDVPRVAPHH